MSSLFSITWRRSHTPSCLRRPTRAGQSTRSMDRIKSQNYKITKLQSYNTRGLCNFVGFDDPEHSLYAISFVLKEPTQSTSACTSPSIVNSRASQVMGSPSSRAVCEVIEIGRASCRERV